MSWHHRHFSLLHCLSIAAAVVISNAFAFLPTTKKAPCVRNSEFSSKFKISMVRNIDLPECLIFYGREAVLDFADDGVGAMIKAGAEKILKEASDIGTPCILLSEGDISSAELVQKMIDGSSVQNLIKALSTLEVGNDESSTYNQSPSPLALLDALDDITIEPRGFGGSSGFGTKLADPPRSPLPKHCVVFTCGVKGRDRCIAARRAGMRVIFIEKKFGDCDADDVVDGVITSFEEIYFIDDIATPGSFWLNPPSPRDENGDRIDPYIIAEQIKRNRKRNSNKSNEAEADGDLSIKEMDEGEMARILADLDSL